MTNLARRLALSLWSWTPSFGVSEFFCIEQLLILIGMSKSYQVLHKRSISSNSIRWVIMPKFKKSFIDITKRKCLKYFWTINLCNNNRLLSFESLYLGANILETHYFTLLCQQEHLSDTSDTLRFSTGIFTFILLNERSDK